MKTATLLVVFAVCGLADTVGKPWFTVRERLWNWAKVSCPAGTVDKEWSYSELIVSDDRNVTQVSWAVPACSDPARFREWTPPAARKLRRFSLPSVDIDGLRKLLDSPNVEGLTMFMNAGPGVGDYQIEIARASGVQKISAVSLSPSSHTIGRGLALLRVICRAKEITGDERPRWCPASEPDAP